MATYNQLMAEHAQMDHDEDFWDLEGDQYHDENQCRKCEIRRTAAAMEIVDIEKTLPPTEEQIRATIFELRIPEQFAAWRDATWLIINDIGQRQTSSISGDAWPLLEYKQLKPYVGRKTRITLCSKVKSFLGSHYKVTKLPTIITSICHGNGLSYEIWDSVARKWSTWPDKAPDVKSYCTLQLPKGPYEKLQWAVENTTHTTNQVMSKQHECDMRLEKEEFLAFGSLRAGEYVQSINILRELGCSNLDHTNPAMTVVLLQALWEAGSPSSYDLRHAHEAFLDPAYCKKLLALLRRRLAAIENNWDKQYSMMTTIQLTLRLLSLTPDVKTQTGCLVLLKDARKVTLKWCHQLKAHIHQSSGHKDIQNDAVGRLLLVALLCYSTFDVEEKHIRQLLGSSNDLSIAAEAQAMVCDNTPVNKTTLPSLVQQSLIRHSKIAHKLEPHINQLLPSHGAGLNLAVRHIWHGVTLGPKWAVQSKISPS
ncbi:hypothetical protein E4T52_08278 [Aureobasidium sp. EXF-3400]|nr:hypothetical protein E4T51_11567 [Aureobasidium sp. EXF-12344]KAI4776784.1 hypothetical protein E4T52_08278 [Aureobasidium sp. EXF-3400]